MKKVLSLVLVLAMVLVCVSAYAGISPQAGFMNDHSQNWRGGNEGWGNANNGDGFHKENNTTVTLGVQDAFKEDKSVDVTVTVDVKDVGNSKTTIGGSNTYTNGSHNSWSSSTSFGGSNTYTSGSNNSWSSSTSFGGSNTYGSNNSWSSSTSFGGSNTYGSHNSSSWASSTSFGGSNTYGSYNTRTYTDTHNIEIDDSHNIEIDDSHNTDLEFKDSHNVKISGSGNTDSSNNSTNYFYFGSFNDNSDYSTNGSHNKSTENKNSGNSSSSSSSSAAAGGSGSGSGSKGSGSGSGSGSTSGKTSGKTSGGSSSSGSSSSGSSKGASSSASSKAIVITGSNGGGSGSGSGSSVKAPSIQLVQVPDTAETTALKNAFAEAIKAGDPKTALPENVASKLSADLKTINEFVTAKLVGDISGLASATVNVAFPTKYAAGDKVVVLFGIPNGASTQWINVNGIIESDGSISMILTSTVLEALAGKTFALAVLSK